MITLCDIIKEYDGGGKPFRALNEVSMRVNRGEFVAVMGRSGCGKTTLLNIIGCIDSMTSGKYTFDETDITALKSQQLAEVRRERIGYVFQAFNLVEELTCEENVALTLGYAKVKKAERRRRAVELLERVGLADKARNYPAQLSGGEKQRVAIARAISNHPPLILADEPTGNLDFANGMEVMNLLAQLNMEGTTILMVTHDEEFARCAQRILHMQDGVFVEVEMV